MFDSLSCDIVGGKVERVKGGQLFAVEIKDLFDHAQAPIAYGVGSEVDFFELRVDDSLEESLSALGHQLIVL